MKTIATINFKGGVGKTTVTWALGYIAALPKTHRVLLFDMDAQMSLTQAIALNASACGGSHCVARSRLGSRAARPPPRGSPKSPCAAYARSRGDRCAGCCWIALEAAPLLGLRAVARVIRMRSARCEKR